MKKILIIFSFIFCSFLSFGQTASITGTIQDLSGQTFNNGTCIINFVPNPNSPNPSQYNVSGASFNLIPSCSINGSGVISATVTRNDLIAPSGSQWAFIVSPNANSQSYILTTTISAASVDLTSQFAGVITSNISVNASQTFPRAYKDSELVLTPNAGQSYWDVTLGLLKIWDGSVFQQIPTSGGSPSFNNVTVNGTLTVNGAGGINAGSNSLTAGAGTFTAITGPLNGTVGATTPNTGTFTSLTCDSLNQSICVGGTAYPMTHAGIQQAFTDACTIGNALGTVVRFPPLSYSGAGFTITCPLRILGSGMGATFLTATSGDLFTLVPSTNFSQNQDWEIAYLKLVDSASGGNVIKANGTTNQVTHVRIHDDVINAASTTGAGITNTGTAAVDEGFDWKIERVFFQNGGIELVQSAAADGLADGLLIADNTFMTAVTNASTLPCINLTSLQGAAQWTVFHNRGGCNAGTVISHGVLECKILYNQFEQPAASTETNSAIIDLMGDTYTIDACEIRGNNINMHAFATKGIRLDKATHTSIAANYFSGSSTTDVVGTANASIYYTSDNVTNAGVTKGLIPTCSATNIGATGTCIASGSLSSSRIFVQFNTAGAGETASGTFTLTFPIPWIAAPTCVATLRNSSSSWNARATVIANPGGTTTSQAFNWDNNAVALTDSSAYTIFVQCQ